MFRWFILVIILMVTVSCPMDEPDPVARLVLVADGVDTPSSIVFEPGDNSRMYVTETKTGLIRIVEDGVVLDPPFLDIADKVKRDTFEQGLLCIVLHPDFVSNGFFYVSYTATNDDLVVERYRVSGNPDFADESSGMTIMRIGQPRATHNGCQLLFGPSDGFLYISTGDGGSRNVPFENAQDLTNPLGKILRVDVDSAEPFAIPPDNPFAGMKGAGFDERIWVYGLRNPWRFTFDRATGDVYIGDVGQFAREEIDFIPANSVGGENFGWPDAEGFECRNGVGDCGRDPDFVPPVYAYGELFIPKSVSGGYVYRGSAIPEYVGRYFYADFMRNEVKSFRLADGAAEDVRDHSDQLTAPDSSALDNVATFGEDHDGELYILEYQQGRIFKMAPAGDD